MRHLARWSLAVAALLFFRGWIGDQVSSLSAEVHEGSEAQFLLRSVGTVLGLPSMLAFFLFSRIDGSRALEHASRQRLRQAIEAEPGLGLTELSQRTGLGWGTTVYHLNRMERQGLVASRDVGRRRAFFLPEHERQLRSSVSLLANAAQVRLLTAVRSSPNASQKEIASAASMGLPLANRYLRQLEQVGLVTSQKEWRVRRYRPTQQLEAQWGELAQRQMSTTPGGHLSVPPTLSPRGTNAP